MFHNVCTLNKRYMRVKTPPKNVGFLHSFQKYPQSEASLLLFLLSQTWLKDVLHAGQLRCQSSPVPRCDWLPQPPPVPAPRRPPAALK